MGLRRFAGIEKKTPEQLVFMRRAGLLISRAHDAIAEQLRPGMRTRELDEIAAAVIADGGGTPNFLGYHGFPATICVSVNEEIVHGIPGDRLIEEGDLVSVDAGCIIEGWHSDAARTHIAGSARTTDDGDLVRVTHDALWDGIAALASASRVGEIGAAIEDSVAQAVGDRFQPLEDFGGHGIGTAMHQPPDVMNYRTRDRGPKVSPGLVLAIEPMLVQGPADYEVAADEWTVRATRGGRAAHWEHSVAVTDRGLFVLTAEDGGAAELAARGLQIAPDPDPRSRG